MVPISVHDGVTIRVLPTDLVQKTLNHIDSCLEPWVQGSYLFPHRSILVIRRPGVGMVLYLDPYKSWEEQGVWPNSFVYRYRPGKREHASAA
jgi:hypothetical protein